MWLLPLSDDNLLWPHCHQGTPDPGWLRMQQTLPVGARARGPVTGMAWSSHGPQHWGAPPPESGTMGLSRAAGQHLPRQSLGLQKGPWAAVVPGTLSALAACKASMPRPLSLTVPSVKWGHASWR